RHALANSALRMAMSFLAVPPRWLYRAIPKSHVRVTNRQAPHFRPDVSIRYQRAQKGVNKAENRIACLQRERKSAKVGAWRRFPSTNHWGSGWAALAVSRRLALGATTPFIHW